MIDINLLRTDPEKVKNNLKTKNYDLDSGLFIEIDSEEDFTDRSRGFKKFKNKLSKDLENLKK